MPEPILLLLVLIVAGGVVLLPLWRRAPVDVTDDARDAAEVRYRVALETLRDVEADRRAGSLDERGYAEQLAEAEARAAATADALDGPVEPGPASRAAGRVAAIATAGVLAVVLVGGSLLPASGIANSTAVNEALAASEEAEAARQDRVAALLDDLEQRPDDTDTLSELADAYLAGSTADDLRRAAAALQILIALDPERADAYERIVGAYLRAGDYVNARRAFDAYAEVETADPAEVAFLDGVIAVGENDPDAAVEAFDRFLELAPDDPRADMVRRLRGEAGG
jgi:cytochrome c-type biogenesis protein CcmI